MSRPCFLVLDPEHAGSISTRKLVIETAKFNVVTAYSSAEAIETLKRFPNLDAAVVDARLQDLPSGELIRRLRELKPMLPMVAIASPGQPNPPGADYVVDSLNPRAVLDALRTICPDETEAIIEHDRELEDSGQ